MQRQRFHVKKCHFDQRDTCTLGVHCSKYTTTPVLTIHDLLALGHQQQLATYTEGERDAWVSALQAASHSRMRQHLESLQKRLKSKLLSMGLTSEAEAIEISDGNANADEATLKHNASVIGKSIFGHFCF